MKGIAFILAMIIFSASLKASAFVSGMATALGSETTIESCCKTTDTFEANSCSDTQEDPQENNEDGCCEGPECDCTCCLHIAYFQTFSTNNGNLNDFTEVKFGYNFLYQADYLSAVFHPPALL